MRVTVVSIAWFSAAVAALVPAWVMADAAHDFESRVRPLLVAKCQECHGEKLAEAGLRLDSRRALLQGSDTGPVVVPGDAAKSRLIAVVRHADDVGMPPTGRLTDDEVGVLESWVAAGAPWSGPGGDDASAPPPSRDAEMAQRITEARASHWAFTLPVRHPAPDLAPTFPADLRAAWQAAPTDRFIARDLSAAGLAPSPPAAPRDLYRRLHYDLTGLPPTAAEADAFAADPSEAAYRAAVERLLASRAHAEHWARHWLDLARYADTKGYVFAGQAPDYPFAWTYRDWVVASLAADLPYDRFVTLQLAADRIEPAVPKADLAALGFLTVGRSFTGNQHEIIDDRIDLVGRGLLGLTIACARCHDHKYEPISAADYYALHGGFASSREPGELPVIALPRPGPEADAFAKKLAELESRVAEHDAAVHARAIRDAVAHAADYFLETARPAPRAGGRPPRLADGYELEQLLIDRLTQLLAGASPEHPILGVWLAVKGLPDEQIAAEIAARWPAAGPEAAAGATPIHPLVAAELASTRPTTLRQMAEVYARLVARVASAAAGGPGERPDDPPETAELRQLLGREDSPFAVPRADAAKLATKPEHNEYEKRRAAITRHRAESPGGPLRAMVLYDIKPVDSPVLLRGNPQRPGPIAPRRLPDVLGGAPLDRGSSGRLDLARAIVSPDNPLAARVLVNWVWTHHFGRGLVPTTDDLGLRGEPPSHPQLLDDLARRFIEEGRWSLRWLHREIVLSQTWRQAAAIRPDLVAPDPDNRLFGRAERRRLSWEAWRDSLLTAAGTLDRDHPGGPGIDPLAIKAMFARSVYARLDRQNVPGLLRTFDIANPDTAVHVRSRTTVPQQGLAQLNAPLVIETARRLAARSAREAGPEAPDTARVAALWRAALARSPSDREQVLAHAWLADARAETAQPADNGFGPWERLAQAVLATAEFQFLD
jgi:cytochrome c553